MVSRNVNQMKLTDILQQRYLSFVNDQDDWVFFCGLADYVSLVLDNDVLRSVHEELIKEREKLWNAWQGADNVAFQALLLVREEIKNRMKKKKIVDEGVDHIDGEIQMLLDKKMQTTASNAEHVYYQLSDMCHRLDKIGHIEILKGLYEEENGLKQTRFRILIEEKDKLKARYDKKKDLELWGMWNHLLILRGAVFYADENMEAMAGDDPFSLNRLNYSCYVSRANEIKNKQPQDYSGGKVFRRKDFKVYIDRLHHYFLSKFVGLEANSEVDVISKKRQEFYATDEEIQSGDVIEYDSDLSQFFYQGNYDEPLLEIKSSHFKELLEDTLLNLSQSTRRKKYNLKESPLMSKQAAMRQVRSELRKRLQERGAPENVYKSAFYRTKHGTFEVLDLIKLRS